MHTIIHLDNNMVSTLGQTFRLVQKTGMMDRIGKVCYETGNIRSLIIHMIIMSYYKLSFVCKKYRIVNTLCNHVCSTGELHIIFVIVV